MASSPIASPSASEFAFAKPDHRVRRVTLGALSNILAQVINSAGQFVTVPVLLAAWGAELYGEWLTLWAAVSYLALVDFGLQTYVVNLLTQCWARGDISEFRRIYSTAIFAAGSVSGVASLLCAVAVGMMPLGEWLNFTITGRGSVALVATILAGVVVLNVPYGVVNGVYRSLGDYARGQMISNLRLAASFVAMIAAASLGWGLVGAAVSQVMVMGATYAATAYDLRRRHRGYVTHLPKPNAALALSFLAPSSLFLILQITMLFAVQGSTLLVGALHGAIGVGVFVTLRTLANVLKQFAATVYHALWPELTSMQARREYELLGQLHQFGAKLSMGSAFLLAIWLHFNGEGLVRLWTRGRIQYDAALMDGLLALFVSECLWFGSSLLLSAANNHRKMSVVVPLSKVVGLGLAALLGGSGWLGGVSWGLAAADIAFCASVVPILACRAIHQNVREFVRQSILKGIIPLTLTAVPALAGVGLFPESGWVRILGTAAWVGIAGSVGSYAFWFNQLERKETRRLLSCLPLFSRMSG